MAYGLDPVGLFPAAPLERYQAGLGEYLGAITADWETNPLPSLRRWYERQAADMGPIGALERFGGPLGQSLARNIRDLGGDIVKKSGPMLETEEVAKRGKELGLALDRPMTEEALDSILAERRRRLANDLVFERARAGAGAQALGVLTELAVTAADPFNIASAFIPITRAPFLAARLAQIGAPGLRRAATGAIEGAVGNLAVEPFVALAALDEDPQYGAVNWLLTAAFGAGLGSGLHWLAGRFARREIEIRTEGPLPSPRERLAATQEQRAEASATSVPAEAPGAVPARPYAIRELNQELSTKVPQDTARLIDAAAPETREAALGIGTAQLLRDRRPDVAFLFDADSRFVAARAAYLEETRFRQELKVSVEELRAKQAFQEQEIARLKANTLTFTPPADFKPSKGALTEARAVKAGRAPGKRVAEPESLAQFVRSKGGIDVADRLAGDLRAQDLGGLSGLLRRHKEGSTATKRAGRSADEIGELAHEAGFYRDRPSAEQVVADLIEDANGTRKTYADMEQLAKFRQWQERGQAWDEYLARLDLDTTRYDERTLAYILSLDPGRQKVIALEEAFAEGRLGEAEALAVAARLETEMAAAQAEAIATARARLADERPEGFEADLEARPGLEARSPEDYTPLTREEFDAVDTELRGLEGRGAEAARSPAEPEAARPGEDGLGPGPRDEFGAPALAAQFPEARFTTEARIDAATLEAFARRQEDVSADLHADADAAARAAAYVEQRATSDAAADLAEVEALARPLLTDADKAAIAEKDAIYSEEKSMLQAFVSCTLGGA